MSERKDRPRRSSVALKCKEGGEGDKSRKQRAKNGSERMRMSEHSLLSTILVRTPKVFSSTFLSLLGLRKGNYFLWWRDLCRLSKMSKIH